MQTLECCGGQEADESDIVQVGHTMNMGKDTSDMDTRSVIIVKYRH
jgi:hypothetical protein